MLSLLTAMKTRQTALKAILDQISASENKWDKFACHQTNSSK